MGLFRKKVNTKTVSVLGENLNFASSEAYKMVRANLRFVLSPKSNECSMFGITSPDSGEGKTTTSINLAYTFAQTGQRVLLIEGDMRLPNIAKRLKIKRKPGLSEVLSGMCDIQDTIIPSGMLDNLCVIPAGTIPPNPSELLGSVRMKELLSKISKQFEVIVMDLPPVNEVSDPIVAASFLDGVALVIRQGFTTRKSIDETIRQLKLAGVNILGVILTMAEDNSKYYNGYKYKYKYGYRKHSETSEYERSQQSIAMQTASTKKKNSDIVPMKKVQSIDNESVIVQVSEALSKSNISEKG